MKRYIRLSIWPERLTEYRQVNNRLELRLLGREITGWTLSNQPSLSAAMLDRQIKICEARRHAKKYGYVFPED